MVGMLSPRENVYSAGVQNTGMTSIDEKDQGNDLSATGKPTRFPPAYWTLLVVAEPKYMHRKIFKQQASCRLVK